MRLPFGFLGLFILSGWAVTALGADGASERSLVRVVPRSPWTLRELEARHLDLVSYDPDTGEIFLTVNTREQRQLLDAGYALSTIEPDSTTAITHNEIKDGILYHMAATIFPPMKSRMMLSPALK